MRILSDDWEVMLSALFRWLQRRRDIWRRWQVGARRLIDGEGASCLLFRGTQPKAGDRVGFWHWAKVASESQGSPPFAEIDRAVLQRIVDEEPPTDRSRAEGRARSFMELKSAQQNGNSAGAHGASAGEKPTVAIRPIHHLRHDGVSRLFEICLNIPRVASVSGHRSWSSLKRYTHLRQTGDKYAGWSWLETVTAKAPKASLKQGKEAT